MSSVLRIGTVFPKHLNLNGDQANLLALQIRASQYGGSCIIEEVVSSDKLDYDIVFLGHGSKAAWKDIESKEPRLLSELANRIKQGKMVFAVASGYEKLANLIGIEVGQGERQSEFISTDGKVGYVNSDSKLEPLTRVSKSILTLLHGPVLIKNPELADEILGEFGFEVSVKPAYLIELDDLASQSRKTAFEH